MAERQVSDENGHRYKIKRFCGGRHLQRARLRGVLVALLLRKTRMDYFGLGLGLGKLARASLR